MGQGNQRRKALARGKPWPEDLHRCPHCLSRRTAVEPGPPMALSHVPTLYGVCADCKTMWEAFPPGWSHDVCEAQPCDNCAFRPGAPEHEDTAEWRSLLAKLRMGHEFKCHKGAPLIIDAEASTIEFDAAWVNHKGRTCAGFHRAVMTRGDWLENRMTVAHVLTTHDQDKLMGDEG